MNKRLSPLQRQRYQDEGIVFPVPVLSVEEVGVYRDKCDDLEEQLGGRPRTVEVRQMHLHFRWAFELATHPRILDSVEDLLGPNLIVWATELFTKHPHDSRVSIRHHRDRPYLSFVGGQTTSAWVALSISTAANGCLRALPRSLEPATQDSMIDVALQAGEMSLHDTEVLHGSGANESNDKAHPQRPQLAMTARREKLSRCRVQRLDNHHGPLGMGGEPVPRVYGLEAVKRRPKRGIFRKACILPTTMRAQAPTPIARRP